MTENPRGRGIEESSLSLLASVTEEELFVAQILLDLPYMFGMLESVTGPKWGGKKRRRSRMRNAPSSSRAPSPPSPSIRRTELVQVREKNHRPKTEEEDISAAATTSPVTPLSFSSGESDEKSRRRALKKISKTRSREEYDNMIEELTRQRDVLRVEIKNVTKHYKKLNAYNSELKAMKQEALNYCPSEENPKLVIYREKMNLDTESTQHRHRQSKIVANSKPFVSDQMAEKFEQSNGPNSAQLNTSRNGLDYLGGPFRIPDLNISAEVAFGVDESQPLDESVGVADRRARFAEARRRRRGIMKIKHMRSACGIKLPETR
ncbi:hypothetical protein ABFS82_03G070100 [Erythranthe guttata]|uniref:Uncharacterized protein n=1 Tax=Erythranthe guttata TaxID=4155 RepID=A0A022RF04_ERYGU|nr:PREDICTED: uncharacterized protein LOC105956373 [Erythranthe guttata]EYU38806.1 hypothetical protein MIMGU_mgv1a010193mg [Erythranthe guttata]|eukprot:XP_012835677.1 PREDICTED: uncharacterized protein LOC105956373 [Erythranthe guttata]